MNCSARSLVLLGPSGATTELPEKVVSRRDSAGIELRFGVEQWGRTDVGISAGDKKCKKNLKKILTGCRCLSTLCFSDVEKVAHLVS